VSIVEKALTRVHGKSSQEPQARPRVDLKSRARIEVDRQRLIEFGLLPQDHEQRRIGDEFRRLKWSLLETTLAATDAEFAKGRSRRAIMVTSSIPAEGKTFVSTNLAMSLALENDHQVLLVDADLARPKLTGALQLDDRKGLSDLLVDSSLSWNDVVLSTDIPGLMIVPCGSPQQRAPELLASKRMAELLDTLEYASNTFTLFDSTPLLVANESQALSRHLGQVVLVIKADSTARAEVQESISLLRGNPNVSCVLNQVQRSKLASYYGEYDGFGEGYNYSKFPDRA
jgi:protein-tyrosine kinase